MLEAHSTGASALRVRHCSLAARSRSPPPLPLARVPAAMPPIRRALGCALGAGAAGRRRSAHRGPAEGGARLERLQAHARQGALALASTAGRGRVCGMLARGDAVRARRRAAVPLRSEARASAVRSRPPLACRTPAVRMRRTRTRATLAAGECAARMKCAWHCAPSRSRFQREFLAGVRRVDAAALFLAPLQLVAGYPAFLAALRCFSALTALSLQAKFAKRRARLAGAAGRAR